MSDVKVYDNGTCTIGERCICDDNGCAKPSTNNIVKNKPHGIANNKCFRRLLSNNHFMLKLFLYYYIFF